MNIEEKTDYWLTSADRDVHTAERLFAGGDYHWCLFISHLVLEKALKACYTKKMRDVPPKTHDLVKLAKLAGIDLNEDKTYFFNKVNDFNIEARYPDEKFSFYKTATKEFSEENFRRIKEEYQWLKSLMK